jgi:hypothetical protein
MAVMPVMVDAVPTCVGANKACALLRIQSAPTKATLLDALNPTAVLQPKLLPQEQCIMPCATYGSIAPVLNLKLPIAVPVALVKGSISNC